jgi:cardiolipin synthase A/B
VSALPGIPGGLVILLAIVGAIALTSSLLTLFFTFGRPERFVSTDRPPVNSTEFLNGIAGTMNAPLQSGGDAVLLNNGVEIFPAILRAIAGAKRSINFMCYIWEDGRASERVFDALLERQRAGVQVRLMIDAVGGMKAPRHRIRELREAGGKFVWYHALRFGRITTFYKRNHRRAIVIDGRLGFTGGAAVADQWLGDAQDDRHWRDQMVEVRGCLANNLQSAFTQLWANVTGEVLLGEDFYPGPGDPSASDEGISRHVHVISSPAQASHPLRIFFWISMACARERIYLASPYFAPDISVRRILAERARAGVDVRLLLPGNRMDAPVVRWAAQRYYEQLLKAGVRIYEYQPTMMHAKSLAVDRRWSVVGSANMDVRSKELNQESVIGILDEGFAAQLEDTFLADLDDAREITLDYWRRRSSLFHLRARISTLFEEQM